MILYNKTNRKSGLIKALHVGISIQSGELSSENRQS